MGFGLGMTATLAFVLLLSSTEKQGGSMLDVGAPDRTLPQIVKGVDLDRPFTFAGEAIPVDNFDIRERLDRELLVNTYWQSSTLLTLKQTKRYFPIIERILREEGLPEDLKYIAVAESGLRNVTSSAGAKGFWQFMSATGKGYGLEISREVDQRYDIEASTRAAAAYLKDYHRKFGSWIDAAAGYNMGGGRLAARMEDQVADNYFEVNLNAETMRYFFRILAFKEIMSQPRDFGFYLDAADYYPPLDKYREVTVTETIDNLGTWAREQGTTYRLLKVYNPWLLENRLTVRSGKEYVIQVPLG
jgi:membrane-bound lytic murein transglycosylase D